MLSTKCNLFLTVYGHPPCLSLIGYLATIYYCQTHLTAQLHADSLAQYLCSGRDILNLTVYCPIDHNIYWLDIARRENSERKTTQKTLIIYQTRLFLLCRAEKVAVF